METGPIYLISDSPQSRRQIESAIAQLESRQIFAVQEISELPSGIGLVILDCNTMRTETLQQLWSLSRNSPQTKILIAAQEIPVSVYRQIVYLQSTFTLQKPYTDEKFLEVLNKVETNQELKPTRFPRFITDQPVRICVLGSGLLIPTRMRNYSGGGAFLEYRGINLKVGDKLQIGFGADFVRPKEREQLKAKVIWIRTNDNPTSPDRGVGIQFIEPEAPRLSV